MQCWYCGAHAALENVTLCYTENEKGQQVLACVAHRWANFDSGQLVEEIEKFLEKENACQ